MKFKYTCPYCRKDQEEFDLYVKIDQEKTKYGKLMLRCAYPHCGGLLPLSHLENPEEMGD